MSTPRIPIGLLTAAFVVAACDATDAVSPPPELPVSAARAESPDLPAPADFVAAVINAFFPLTPGTVFRYRSETEGGEEEGVTEVTDMVKVVAGIQATVVHDQVFLEGELTEDTYDWYAEDRWGNVWYLGEDSCEIEDGQCVSKEGSWEAGVGGARAGILMWANPADHVGRPYRQELYEGVAEDMAQVLRLGVSVAVPAGEFDGCVETMDSTPLEPGAREDKFYCPGTGLALEVSPRGGRERNELVEVTIN